MGSRPTAQAAAISAHKIKVRLDLSREAVIRYA
jgi:hypothetical protein